MSKKQRLQKMACFTLILTGFTSTHIFAANRCIEQINNYVNKNVLSLKSCDLNDSDINDVTAFLYKHPEINTVDVSDGQIGAQGATNLALIPSITKLDISFNKIGDSGAFILACGNISSLNEEYNNIGDKGAFALAHNNKLHELNISQNEIGVEGLKALGNANSIHSLKLSHNRTYPNITNIGALLANNKSLTHLDVSNNWIMDDGAIALASNNNLISLNLDDSGIGAKGAIALANLPRLNELSISDNNVGEAGAIAIANNKSLTSLKILYNDIGDKGAIALAQNPHIEILWLGRNHHIQTTQKSSHGICKKYKTLKALWIHLMDLTKGLLWL